MFGFGGTRETVAEQGRMSDRADNRTRAQIADGRARGVNIVRVADVRQRHSTGTGSNGTTIRGRLHS